MRYVSKEFLSPSAHESGSIVCTVETSKPDQISNYRANQGGGIDASIRLADCSEHVIIDFNATGKKAFDKRLKKIDKMLEEITLFREQYIACWNQHQVDIKAVLAAESEDSQDE